MKTLGQREAPRRRVLALFVAAVFVFGVMQAASAACDGTVDVRDIDTVSWAVTPSLGDQRYSEIRRYGQWSTAPSASAVSYVYRGYGKPPAVKRADTSNALFTRAIGILAAAHILRLEPKSGPQPVVHSDGTITGTVRLDGTTTSLGFKRCGVTVQLQMRGNDDPRLTVIAAKLDALVRDLPWVAASSERAPAAPPLFQFPL